MAAWIPDTLEWPHSVHGKWAGGVALQNVISCNSIAMEAEFNAEAPTIQCVNYCPRILNSTGLPVLSVNFASTNWSENESSRIVAANSVHHQRT